MAYFDADLPVNNSKLPEMEILGENVEVSEKKGILYISKDDITIELTGNFKEKNNGDIEGTVTALVCKTGDDEPTWDISNMSYDFDQLFIRIDDGKLDKVISEIFEDKDTIWGSHFDDELYGFKGNDTVVGWNGDDRLNGGQGKDTLEGKRGADTYVFDQNLTSKNVDTIVKFNENEDLVELKQKIFTELKTGELHEDYFTVGKNAEGDDPQIIYRPDKGHLLYDSDGAGGKDPLKFADIGKNKDLTHDDFFVS
jgi:Ca2+-binding RTX toxin-like protein